MNWEDHKRWCDTYVTRPLLAEGEDLPKGLRRLGVEEAFYAMDRETRSYRGEDGVCRVAASAVPIDAPKCPAVPDGYVDPAALHAPDGYVLPPEGRCTSAGYRGGIGYGWLGYEAGDIRQATMRDYIDGRCVTIAEATEMLNQQRRKQRNNQSAFYSFLNT